MKNLKLLSNEANLLRKRFQELVLLPYIKENGYLKGYNGQIYILLPEYKKNHLLYRGFSIETYHELKKYLLYNQSQRRFNQPFKSENILEILNKYSYDNLSKAYSRVWHNAVGYYGDDKSIWASIAMAVFNRIDKHGFIFYERDYNFSSRSYDSMRQNFNPLLVSVFGKKIDRILEEVKGV